MVGWPIAYLFFMFRFLCTLRVFSFYPVLLHSKYLYDLVLLFSRFLKKNSFLKKTSSLFDFALSQFKPWDLLVLFLSNTFCTKKKITIKLNINFKKKWNHLLNKNNKKNLFTKIQKLLLTSAKEQPNIIKKLKVIKITIMVT